MKKLAIFLILFSLLSNLFSQNVSVETAKTVATNWYRHYAPSDKLLANINKTVEYKLKDATNFYIFSFDQGGFVIVSAKSQIEPILGYGFEGEIPETIYNPAIKNIFDIYAMQIDTLSSIDLKSAYINPKWANLIGNVFLKSAGTSVVPLLKTTWDQGCYYNEMCPADASGSCGHTLVGCTAVAMAQIMKFWNYPEKGIGQLDYIGKTNGIKYGSLSVFFNETKYDWSSMENKLNNINNSVSSILYHCGVSAKMDYGPISSGAYLNNVASLGLVKYFDYAPSLTHVKRNEYTDESWLLILRNELDKGRPILYEGYNSNNTFGHAFVCDGYQNNDFFHLNFGWSGNSDGFYYLNNILPPSSNFSFYQGAIIGIEPNYSPLKANFELKKTQSQLEYQFVDFSTGNPTSWLWDFGDGTTSGDHNPIHTYVQPGDYLLTLTVNRAGIESKITIKKTIQKDPFTNIQAPLGGLQGKSIWFDYDSDGDLDLLQYGYPVGDKLYNNNIGVFSEVTGGISGKGFSWGFDPQQFEVGDYDLDGDLDLILLVFVNHLPAVIIYQNNSGKFKEIDLNIPDITSIKWVDGDLDGDLDILLTGKRGPFGYFASKYICEKGKYYEDSQKLPGLDGQDPIIQWIDTDNDGNFEILYYGLDISTYTWRCSLYDLIGDEYKEIKLDVPLYQFHQLEWGDFDNDGDLDILVFANDWQHSGVANVYRNDGDTFVNIHANLNGSKEWSIGCQYIKAQWLDFNLDGLLDIAITENCQNSMRLFRNDNGNFVDLVANNEINYANSIWLDYDDDGDLDILDYNKVFKNEEGTFKEVYLYKDLEKEPLNNLSNNVVGDFDNDKDLDFVTSGLLTSDNGTLVFESKIYRNNSIEKVNSSPEIPAGLKVQIKDNEATIFWNPSIDDVTPPNKITYNVFIGTKADSANILSSMTDLKTGFLQVVKQGNAGYKTSINIKNLTNGNYYASVQAIDHLFKSSPFTTPIEFKIQGENLKPRSYSFNQTSIINTTLSFATNDFTSNYQDPEDDLLKSIKVVSLPKYGTLEFDGQPIAIGQDILSNEIQKLSFITTKLIDDSIEWKGFDGSNISIVAGVVKISVVPYSKLNAGVKDTYNQFFSNNSVSFGDYNNDRYLDFLIIGQQEQISTPKIYKNNNATFNEIAGILPMESADAAEWGDYDNDGDLDLVITGEKSIASPPFTSILRNDNGQFIDINAGLVGVRSGMLAWSDFDNDGDLDLTVSGIYNQNNERITKIYRNHDRTFVDINAELPGVNVGSIAWGDLDNDGDLDLLLTGARGTTADIISKVYRNDNSKFIEMEANLPGCYLGRAIWSDYDNDGDLDILMSGIVDGGVKGTRIFQNQDATFKPYYQQQVYNFNDYGGNITSLDYDYDGDLDYLIQGTGNYNFPLTRLYQNSNNIFAEIKTGIPDLINSSGSAGDIDNDGDIDLLIIGKNKEGQPSSDIYRNNLVFKASTLNEPPSTPQNLSTQASSAQSIKLIWEKATDSSTPQESLTYNLFIGTSPDNCQIMSPMSDLKTGFRKIPKSGNVGSNNFYEIENLIPGKYYWSVQAIDNSYLGGSFAPVGSFEIAAYSIPSAKAGADLTVLEGAMVTLDASSSFNPINNILTYKWTCPDGITLSSNTDAKPTFIAPETNRVTKLTFYLVVNNGISDSEKDEVVVTVLNIPKTPFANAGSDQIVNKGASIELDGSASFDPDGDALIYNWTAPNGIILSSSSVAKPTFIAPIVTQDTPLTFLLIVSDGMMVSAVDEVVITVKGVNKIPIPNAGTDQIVMEGAVITLDGSASSDPDGNSLIYKWATPIGVNLSSSSVQKPTFTAPEVTHDTPYIFSLVVNDGSLDSPVDQVIITVKNVNKAPIANAGYEQTVNEGTNVILDGSGSSDADLNNLVYTWSGPEKVILSDNKSPKPAFTTPEVNRDSSLTFSLVVNDGFINSVPSTVIVKVLNVIRVGVNNMSKSELMVYPNPTTGVITIKGLPTNQKNEITIQSVDGKLIKKKTSNSATETIDISDQVSGTYLLKITNQPFKIQKK